MVKRARSGKRPRHGTRKWVLTVLQSPEAAGGILTADIQRQVDQASGAKIPAYSVYQALRTLVKRKEARATRKGREYSYRLMSAEPATPAPTIAETEAPALPVAGGSQLPHKIAPGEVTILEIGETHVETASNLHGKLVLQRHPRPK